MACSSMVLHVAPRFRGVFGHTHHKTYESHRGGREGRGLASATRVANAFPDKLTSDLDALRGCVPIVSSPTFSLCENDPLFSSPLLFFSLSISFSLYQRHDPPSGDAQRTTTPLLLAAAKLVNRVS